MLTTLRRDYAHLVTSGAQLLLLIIGIRLESRTGWLWVLGIMAVVSLFAWLSALRRLRTIRDTPTSHIASAAQGYVELTGTGKPLPGQPLLSNLTQLPCLWYRYRIERKDYRGQWRHEDSGESNASFLIQDTSGSCEIDPSGAEITTSHKQTWHEDNYRYTEWHLLEIDTIYAVGHFYTAGGSTIETDLTQEMGEVLTEWKENMPELLKRFDLDGDGELNLQEWGLARSAARREAEKRLEEAHNQPDSNYLIRPKDGRLYLISNLPENKLERRYWFWTFAHLIIFFGALGGLSWILSRAAL